MGSDRNLGRLQDIKDKDEVEMLGDNRAVIRANSGSNSSSSGSRTKSDEVSDQIEKTENGYQMKFQVKRGDKRVRKKLRADTMRGLVQKFAMWASSATDEDLEDIIMSI